MDMDASFRRTILFPSPTTIHSTTTRTRARTPFPTNLHNPRLPRSLQKPLSPPPRSSSNPIRKIPTNRPNQNRTRRRPNLTLPPPRPYGNRNRRQKQLCGSRVGVPDVSAKWIGEGEDG